MYKLFTLVLLFPLTVFAQSEYLHLLSGEHAAATPKPFILTTSKGFFPAERVALSSKGNLFYFSERNGYDANSSGNTQYYQYHQDKWHGPFLIDQTLSAPSLSPSDKKLYLQNEGKEHSTTLPDTFYRNKETYYWQAAQLVRLPARQRHYLQETNSGNVYFSSLDKSSGMRDIYKVSQPSAASNSSETKETAMGFAKKMKVDMDYFIARDESFIILTHDQRYCISFQSHHNRWTAPVELDSALFDVKANWKWGPYVTPDNKFMFFTAGNDNATTKIYWVEFEKELQHNKLAALHNTQPNRPLCGVDAK